MEILQTKSTLHLLLQCIMPILMAILLTGTGRGKPMRVMEKFRMFVLRGRSAIA